MNERWRQVLDRLDETTLTPIVRRALHARGAVPVAWRWALLPYAAFLPRRVLVGVEGEADVNGRTVLAQYECGLRDAGWQGDSVVVRLGYAAAVALRWFLVPATLHLLADPFARERAERTTHNATVSLLRQPLALLDFLLDRAVEARRLAQRY